MQRFSCHLTGLRQTHNMRSTTKACTPAPECMLPVVCNPQTMHACCTNTLPLPAPPRPALPVRCVTPPEMPSLNAGVALRSSVPSPLCRPAQGRGPWIWRTTRYPPLPAQQRPQRLPPQWHSRPQRSVASRAQRASLGAQIHLALAATQRGPPPARGSPATHGHAWLRGPPRPRAQSGAAGRGGCWGSPPAQPGGAGGHFLQLHGEGCARQGRDRHLGAKQTRERHPLAPSWPAALTHSRGYTWHRACRSASATLQCASPHHACTTMQTNPSRFSTAHPPPHRQPASGSPPPCWAAGRAARRAALCASRW